MRILISTYTNIQTSNKKEMLYNLPAFYEGFIKSLSNEGNEIYIMISNEIIENYHQNNELIKTYSEIDIDNTIKELNFDLVISFNHSLYQKIPELVNCPILIWIVDSVRCLTRLDIVKKRKERYFIIVPVEVIITEEVKRSIVYLVNFSFKTKLFFTASILAIRI